MRYSIEPRTRKDIKAYRFLWFARNQFDKYGKNVLNTATKTGLDPAKTASTTSALIGNKMAEKFLKTDASSRNIEEINISPEKREDILNK